MILKGSFVALITPFNKDGTINEKKFAELVEFQIKNGTNGLVPCGCTGEAATLTHDEQKKLIKLAVEIVNKRIPVIAGTGSNNTSEALDLTRFAKRSGADAALLITPYYNKPTAEGLYKHYELIAREVDIPIVLYNVPSRTGISILPETVARLSKIKNIVAIKEASGSLDQISQIISLCDITVLSGDDSLTLPILAVGGKGVVSVVANIVPKDVAMMVDKFLKGDLDSARKLHYKLLPLSKAMFIETNPICVKTAMGIMGLSDPFLRLPLCEMQPSNVSKLKEVMKSYRLI